MTELIYNELDNNPGKVTLASIPELEYGQFFDQTVLLMKKESNHCLIYFSFPKDGFYHFYILIANDNNHKILIYSHKQKADIKSLKSISALCLSLHVFEREIHEITGIDFDGHPWLKPVRYPHNRFNPDSVMAEYPFYKIEGEEIHEVGVGPIHAGVIEPGHFRFQCYGEKVLHLEIQLGYQHRGIEELFIRDNNLLKCSVLSENIAGDTVVGHGLAFAQLAEHLTGREEDELLRYERIIALEMERIAVNIGDTAALCGDVAYQIGQVSCEALRTIVINTMQDWCGNRFAKGLIRPGGTYYPLSKNIAAHISGKLEEVRRRFSEIALMIYDDSGIQARFENTGTVSQKQALLSGAVGMAARSSGIVRDIRMSHPFQAYKEIKYLPARLEQGDVFARALLRKIEFDLSFSVINELLKKFENVSDTERKKPDYKVNPDPETLFVSVTEGWRGEICHIVITDVKGIPVKYKIKDPSLHNWYALALAVRNQEISDFPICNKSFNLSYCGNDL
jgi:Ni,Fe-hydrogenase III large subunit/NADH:ubiquinone oxidoreductase subunit C